MPPQWSVDAVWDIETTQWDQFLCGALWTKDLGTRVFRTPRDLANAILSLPVGAQAWAHSGGKFDVLWLIDYLAEEGDLPDAVVTMSGSSATSVKFKDGPWMRDSARLLPMSLAKAAKIAGPDRAKGDPGIAFEDMHQNMAPEILARIEEYMVGDVTLLRDILYAVLDYAESHNIELRGTIGGTAWSTASKWCGLEDADWDAETYRMVRDAYYGGRCEVAMTLSDYIYRYDRKSAYPASLMLPVPVGEPRLCDPRAARKAFEGGKPGSYNAVVMVPESLRPPLPIRHRDRLAYPYGRVEGSWPHVELQHAVNLGCKIERFYSAVVWDQEEARLQPYAKSCFDLRDNLPVEQKDALGVWLKFLANSLTGKLGQSPEWQIVTLGDFADDSRYEQVGSSPWVWSRDVWRIPQCAMVHWAMTLTGRARVELHSQIEHAGDAWVYSDTDSCFSTRQLTRNIGEDLGDWAYEWSKKSKIAKDMRKPNGAEWEARAPKVYTYVDMSMYERIAHAKGVPGAKDGDTIDYGVWKSYTSGEIIRSDRGVKSLKVAARGGENSQGREGALFARRSLTRQFHESEEWCGARLRTGNARTRAPNVTDLARLK